MAAELVAVVDEDNVERQRQARWFADAKAGLNHELERTLGSRPPQDWKGHAYEWIHLKGQHERTAFHAAAEAGQLHTVELLAERGANVLDVDLANETALHAAACNGHIDVMAWLVEHGVPVDSQSKTGATPLLCAVRCGHQNAVLHLLRAKAAVDLGDDHMKTPLILAARENRVEIAQLLLRYGASMHAADSTQETPLTYAQGSMRTLLWTTSATRGDLAGLRQLLACQVGGRGGDSHTNPSQRGGDSHPNPSQRGGDPWKELGRALYHPQGQDLHKLGLHRLLCNCRDGRGASALSLAVQAR